eukprot:9134541-Alexandrium_andersonii.AAC.1
MRGVRDVRLTIEHNSARQGAREVQQLKAATRKPTSKGSPWTSRTRKVPVQGGGCASSANVG